MRKEEKELMKHLVEKELKQIRETEEDIEFPSLGFLKSREIYERKLKELLKKIK